MDDDLILISIHALLAESDAVTTLGAGSVRDFYPRSPCGERPLVQIIMSGYARISIHALLAESDPARPTANNATTKFLSTLSLRRATAQRNLRCQYLPISIHALLAESDPPCVTSFNGKEYFYPRSPCGERLFEYIRAGTCILFLSTLSLRRATISDAPSSAP